MEQKPTTAIDQRRVPKVRTPRSLKWLCAPATIVEWVVNEMDRPDFLYGWMSVHMREIRTSAEKALGSWARADEPGESGHAATPARPGREDIADAQAMIPEVDVVTAEVDVVTAELKRAQDVLSTYFPPRKCPRSVKCPRKPPSDPQSALAGLARVIAAHRRLAVAVGKLWCHVSVITSCRKPDQDAASQWDDLRSVLDVVVNDVGELWRTYSLAWSSLLIAGARPDDQPAGAAKPA